MPKQGWYPGGYRANIVTYSIAKLVLDAEACGRPRFSMAGANGSRCS